MKVSRASKHEDPDIMLRGMDVLELLSSSVPAEWVKWLILCYLGLCYNFAIYVIVLFYVIMLKFSVWSIL